MGWRDDVRTTGRALWHWFLAQCLDALAVAVLWLIGLLIIGIPWAPLWAVLAGVLQFVPHVGQAIAAIIPAILGFFTPHHLGLLWVALLYVGIMLLDGLLLQPYFMKRTAKVPFWISLLTPIAILLLIPTWWAILLAPPLLAVIFAFRSKWQHEKSVLKNG